jgi:hypothetical protein
MEHQQNFFQTEDKTLGEVFTRVCKHLEVSKLKTSSFHPQTNGFTECFNKTLGAHIENVHSGTSKELESNNILCLYAYNMSYYPTIQKTPFFLMFARVSKTIDDLLSDVITKDTITIEERRKFIEQQFMEIKNKIAANTNKVLQKQLSNADKYRIDHNFQQKI